MLRAASRRHDEGPVSVCGCWLDRVDLAPGLHRDADSAVSQLGRTSQPPTLTIVKHCSLLRQQSRHAPEAPHLDFAEESGCDEQQ